MGVNERTIQWREKHKDYLEGWKEKMVVLQLRAHSEGWSQDRYEMEIIQCIPNQSVRDVFIYAKNYIYQYKTGKFRSLMANVYEEVIRFGLVEPSRLVAIKRAIDSVRRKVYGK